jgi:multidrug resistance efflux pump
MTIHEFAHGLTLKHFGGKTKEMGFLILYFIPAFYCNVSDAWMLKKRERLLVTLAGSYIQVFIWACATVLWRLFALETLASQVCLIIIGFSAIQMLFNLIPLIRMDGYYLLSDILEVPNLRPKAFGFLKRKIAAWVTGMPPENKEMYDRREKIIFSCYGLSSFLFTTILLMIMIQRLGGWMVQQYQGWGLFVSSMFFLVGVPIAAKENSAWVGNLFKSGFKRVRKTPLFFIILALIIAGGFLPWELKISGDFSVTALNRISASPQVVGNLKKIYVEQGDRVRRGDVLAEIENLDLSNSRHETAGELASQRAALDLLIAGSRPEEIDKARKAIDTKKAELFNSTRIDKSRALLLETVAKKTASLENAKLNYERTQNLLENGVVARNEADRDRTAYQVQQKELQEAKGQLAVLEEQTENDQDIKRKELAQAESELRILLAGSRKESLRALEAQVNMLEEKLTILNRQMELLKIQSPIDGVVASPFLKNRIGDFLDKGDVFCEIVSEGMVIIEMPVPEKEIDAIHVGLPITMKLRGYPKRWYEARVRNIAPVAVVSGLERTVMVQGELENKDGSIRTGMTGVGKILCGKRKIAEIITRRAIRWLRTEFWEYLP